MGVKKLFLVDNDDIFCIAAEVLIKAHDLAEEVVRFENGLEVFNALMTLVDNANELPEILFLDINMPVMNGWECLDELKGAPEILRQKIKIYVLTSSIAQEDISQSKNYDFLEGYIAKPLTIQDIEKVRDQEKTAI